MGAPISRIEEDAIAESLALERLTEGLIRFQLFQATMDDSEPSVSWLPWSNSELRAVWILLGNSVGIAAPSPAQARTASHIY